VVTTPVHWLLAYTKPRGEKIAEDNLRRQGFECVLPWISVQKRRRGKWLWIDEPLFPRYVCVGAHEDQSWAPVRSTLGVTSLVRFGTQFATVPETLIRDLMTGADEGPERQLRFKQGQKVHITGDSFSSIVGIFEMQEGEDRARVLIDLLGRPTSVHVPLSQLVPED
jgi:transcriptional antiterminator RfaH